MKFLVDIACLVYSIVAAKLLQVAFDNLVKTKRGATDDARYVTLRRIYHSNRIKELRTSLNL